MSSIEFNLVSPPQGRARVIVLGGIATCVVATAAIFGIVWSGGDHPFKSGAVDHGAGVEVLPVPEMRPGSGETAIARDWRSMDDVARELSRISPAAASPAREWLVQNGNGHDSVGALMGHFEQAGYQLSAVRDDDRHVPRLYVDFLPSDLADMASPQERKRVFIAAMLPLILRVNEEIRADRERAIELRDHLAAGSALSQADRTWLYAVSERYEADAYDFPELLKHMDAVPPSLALAQAAEESGWGTSRFAQEGNALFGQYTFKEGAGMRPLDRDADRQHYIKAYSSLVDTVRGYMHNLNYHRAYGEFRERRAKMRAADQPVEGYVLAEELRRYSERGPAYIRTIRQIIRANALDKFDDARLQGEQLTDIQPAGDAITS